MTNERARTRLVLLNSFRRGAGKSTLAANLAALAHASGQRVGLVDSCFSAPALHVFFGLYNEDHRASFYDFLSGRQALEETALDVTGRLGLAEAGRLYLLPASQRIEDRLASLHYSYDLAHLAESLQLLSRSLRLDLLVVDSPAGVSENNLSLLALADTVLMTLRPEPMDFQGTAVLVDVARRLDVPQIQLVLNDVAAVYDIADLKARTEAALGCPVAAVMPHDEGLLACGSSGLYALQPSVRWSRPWKDLIRTCMDVPEGSPKY